MGDGQLHLVKIPIQTARLMATAKRRGIALRDLDEGYLAHCVLRELWQEKAPQPFLLKGSGRTLDAWGYSRTDAVGLKTHARDFSDPSLLDVLGDVDAIASRPVPTLAAGRRVGFQVRVCPVVRLSKPVRDHRKGAEVDAFLAACFQAGVDESGEPIPVSREAVYRDWLMARLGDVEQSGAQVSGLIVTSFARERFVRRDHKREREAKRLERPEVRLEGELTVVDGEKVLALLARGVGRHRAFGFGALLLTPPGSSPREE